MAAANLDPGTIFHDRYQIQRAIRSGGMGEVYRALDRETNMLVAIKRMLAPALVEGADSGALYQAQRFEEECKLLQNLSIPGVPAFVESFVDSDRKVIVMEFIEGVDLEKQILDQMALANADLPVLQAVEYTIQVAKILEYLHAHRPRPIVHRDVKPANIIVRYSDNRIYLVDFGLAREVGGGSSNTAVGTVGYAPLEQYQGRPTTRTDQYSLGVTLHFMLSGRQPVPLNIEPLDSIKPNLPHELCWVVRKATQPEQEDRFDSMLEFRRKLEELLPSLAAHQREQEVQMQTQGRIELMGPTEEIEAQRPAQRLKTSAHREADEPLKDFGLYNPLQDSVSTQAQFQREAVRAEIEQRLALSEDERRKVFSWRQYTGLLGFVLLLAGILSLFFLNRAEQTKLAQQICGTHQKVERAMGFSRQPKGIALGRKAMFFAERWLAWPSPANDGWESSFSPAQVRRIRFHHRYDAAMLEDDPPTFLVALVNAQGEVVRHNQKPQMFWLSPALQRWRVRPSDVPKEQLSLGVQLSPPLGQENFKDKVSLECTTDSRRLLVLVPPSSGSPIYFSQVDE